MTGMAIRRRLKVTGRFHTDLAAEHIVTATTTNTPQIITLLHNTTSIRTGTSVRISQGLDYTRHTIGTLFVADSVLMGLLQSSSVQTRLRSNIHPIKTRVTNHMTLRPVSLVAKVVDEGTMIKEESPLVSLMNPLPEKKVSDRCVTSDGLDGSYQRQGIRPEHERHDGGSLSGILDGHNSGGQSDGSRGYGFGEYASQDGSRSNSQGDNRDQNIGDAHPSLSGIPGGSSGRSSGGSETSGNFLSELFGTGRQTNQGSSGTQDSSPDYSTVGRNIFGGSSSSDFTGASGTSAQGANPLAGLRDVFPSSTRSENSPSSQAQEGIFSDLLGGSSSESGGQPSGQGSGLGSNLFKGLNTGLGSDYIVGSQSSSPGLLPLNPLPRNNNGAYIFT